MLLIRQDVERLTLKAQGVPQPERLALGLTKSENLDLISSNLFVRDIELHGHMVEHARAIGGEHV